MTVFTSVKNVTEFIPSNRSLEAHHLQEPYLNVRNQFNRFLPRLEKDAKQSPQNIQTNQQALVEKKTFKSLCGNAGSSSLFETF